MCYEWLSEQTVILYISDRLVFMTEVESVYSAVHTDSLYNINNLALNGLILPSLVPFITSSEMSPWDFPIVTLCVFLNVCIRATWYAHLSIDLFTLTSE